MKVLFVSNDPLIFNENSSVRARMREYATRFGELHIIAPAGKNIRFIKDGALTLHPVHGRKPIALLRMIARVRRIVGEEGIELVSAQDPFEYGVVACLGMRGTKAKLHVQIHTDFLSPWFVKGSLLDRVRVFLADWVLTKAQGIRVVSKRIQQSLTMRYGSRISPVSVIPLTVSAHLPPAIPLPSHDFSFALMTIARLEKEKRIDDILHALVRVDARIGLFVVGDGRERRYLEALTKSLGLSGRVVFLGWRTDSLALLQSADAYIQASAYEGYGRTLVEAALAQVPIITTDVGIVGDILVANESALVAGVGDREVFAKSIEVVMQDDSLRSRLKEKAYEKVVAHVASLGNLADEVCANLSEVAFEQERGVVH